MKKAKHIATPFWLIAAAVMLCTLLLVSGCASNTPSSNTAENTSADQGFEPQVEELSLVKSDDPMLTFAANSATAVLNGAPATDQTLAGDSVERFNSCYSPASMYFALAMLTEGTAGNAQAQLLESLGADSSESLMSYCRQSLNTLEDTVDGYDLKLANSIWTSKDYSFKQSYLDAISENLDSAAYDVAFGTNEANTEISNWVKEHTEGLIDPQFDTQVSNVALLINTLYFKDSWINPFMQENSSSEVFHTTTGDVDTLFMHENIDSTLYGEGDGYTAAQLTFQGGATMTFYLPDEGTEPTALVETPEKTLSLLTTELDYENVDWALPKFKIESSFNSLIESLKAIGIVDVFDPDIAGMFEPMLQEGNESGFFVDKVIQETYLDLNEDGVEAAAYSAIGIEKMALVEGGTPIQFTLDRPFAYSIQSPEGTVLFMGVVENPAA